MIGILYREGIRPLLITVIGCTMNGGQWLAGLQPRHRAMHGGATTSAHRSCPCSHHGGPYSTRLVPMASERRGKTLFAHLVHRRLKQRPRNVGRLTPLFLVDGKLPWWSSGSVLTSNGGGGGKGSFPRSWLGTGRGEAAQSTSMCGT
jgi:hypothetical protein